MLVSNGEFMEFVLDNGYSQINYWDREGQAWLKSVQAKHPLFWVEKSNKSYDLRTMN